MTDEVGRSAWWRTMTRSESPAPAPRTRCRPRSSGRSSTAASAPGAPRSPPCPWAHRDHQIAEFIHLGHRAGQHDRGRGAQCFLFRRFPGRRSCPDFVSGSRTLACRLPPRLVTRKPAPSPICPNAIAAPVGIAAGIVPDRSACHRTRPEHDAGPGNATHRILNILAVHDCPGWCDG